MNENQLRTWCLKHHMNVAKMVSHRDGKIIRAYLDYPYYGKARIVEYNSETPGELKLIGYIKYEKRKPFTKSATLAKKTMYSIEVKVGRVILNPHILGVHKSQHPKLIWE